MPVIIKNQDITPISQENATVSHLLTRENTISDNVRLDLVTLDSRTSWKLALDPSAIGWIQVMKGQVTLTGHEDTLTTDHIAYMPQGYTGQCTGLDEAAEILVAIVPQAERFDPNLDAIPQSVTVKEWSREPVLQSEHDARTRIYLATPKMAGTEAYRGEMITYPPGASAPLHHHEGAEHFQFMTSGTATAILDGAPHQLHAGDVLYNFEREQHTFMNETNETFSFVEFFVPGPCKTVWTPGADVCAWLPTGKDVAGRVPVRDIAYHVHGQDDGI